MLRYRQSTRFIPERFTGMYPFMPPHTFKRAPAFSPEITAVDIAPSRTRISWTVPSNTSYKLLGYEVEVCVANESCAAGSRGKVCTIVQTTDSSLQVKSTAGAIYCVQVTPRAQCREKVLTGTPAFQEIRTPFKVPGDFDVKATVTEPRSALVVVSVPQAKNGALDRCLISYNDTDGEHSFSCDHHKGRQSAVVIGKLKPETDYSFAVTFVNIHGGREFSTRKVITITTPADPLRPRIDWKFYGTVLLLPFHFYSIYRVYNMFFYD
ncbi:hypothetical protein MTO96_007700 [Rhipicephalus appendiculatus]